MGDNVDVARALALVHVHTARALFFIILIILKAKLIFLIYLISTPRRASCKIYQNPRTKRAGFLEKQLRLLGRGQCFDHGMHVLQGNIIQPVAQQLGRVQCDEYEWYV